MIKKRSPCFTFKGVLYPSHPFFNPMTPFYHYSKPPNPNISATSQPYNSGRYLTAVSCPLFPVVLCLDRSVPSQSQYLAVPWYRSPNISPFHVSPFRCSNRPMLPVHNLVPVKKHILTQPFCQKRRLSSKKGCQRKAVKKQPRRHVPHSIVLTDSNTVTWNRSKGLPIIP